MKKVGILYHPVNKAAYALARELVELLSAQSITVWLCSSWEGEKARAQLNDTDFLLSIGGDGTILRAAQVAVPKLTPIIGINLGTLGFMTELTVDEARTKLPAMLAGEGWIDERALIEAELPPKEHESTRTFYALNDVVVARGAIARLLYIETSVDGEPLTTYKADGVIVATATGSTSYALAAGGPILHPQADEILLLPISAHLSSSYAMVLPATSVVRLRITTPHQATLSIDGHINLVLSSGDITTVKRSPYKVHFLRTHPASSFYRTLETKLKGKR